MQSKSLFLSHKDGDFNATMKQKMSQNTSEMCLKNGKIKIAVPSRVWSNLPTTNLQNMGMFSAQKCGDT